MEDKMSAETDRYLGADGGIHAVIDALERKFALSRCWWEPFPGRVYIRYATGASEWLSPNEARALLGVQTDRS